ncbi:pentatricopeptide repeat-containing protein At2g13420, mitochondrial-like [Durio zibethinus]|uniref:Pentatricopeptide repeat-containing protein At2g13420, mitochondrial-like n=1 Tax=Durio zibethinus TaxID=66656 RepID=A0A6P5YTK2_DURZI|nr:pentatricopeptide repeat-containing protein At2g13420, mitochondrial-like [Durio zibethinus]
MPFAPSMIWDRFFTADNDTDSFIKTVLFASVSCSTVDTLCKDGYVKVAVEIFNKRKSGFRVDSKMYSVFISGWCKIGRTVKAERFCKDVMERGMEANVVTYHVMLNGICRTVSLHLDERFNRTIRDAEKQFDEMRQRGIEPDITGISIVLRVYSRAHKPELTLDTLKYMKKKGMAAYTSVIKCHWSRGRLKEAETLLVDMVNNGVSPQMEIQIIMDKDRKLEGIGAIITDAKGQSMGADSDRVSWIANSFIVEATAAIRTLNFAKEMCFNEIVSEGDVLSVITPLHIRIENLNC